MKHLFVIRHGSYDNWDENLTSRGREQMEILSRDMGAIVEELHNGHYLLSSTAPRAEQSAEIIAKAFGLESFDREARLHTEGGYSLSQEELEEIDGMIAPHKDNNDIVTLVTHYEVVGSYPNYILRTLLGNEDDFISRPGKGEGVHFDLVDKKYNYLPLKN